MTAAANPTVPPGRRRGPTDYLYALLILAFPAELRNEFSEDMIGMFRAQREAAGGDPVRRARLWLLAVGDVAVHAAKERLDARRPDQDGYPSPPRFRRRLADAARALGNDLAYAVRTLVRRPRFTALVALILALGVGTSTAVFGVVDATLMRPLPYPHAERLVDLWTHMPDGGFTINAIQLDAVRAWSAQGAIFEQVQAYDRESAVIVGAGEPERSAAAAISPGLLPLLGVAPTLGRGFTAEDTTPGADSVVLISEGLWRRRFGAAGDVLGEKLQLDDTVHTVIGVLPAWFRFPGTSTEVWRTLPIAPSPEWDDKATINAVGLLRPDLPLERAQALADAASEDLKELLSYPYVRLRPWEELRAAPETRSSLLMLLGAVGFLVLIAAANLANLLLAQTITRADELAVRTALGASRGRVARQTVAECALLALIGGALGTLLASVLLRVSLNMVPASLVNRLSGAAAVDGRVALFAMALSLTIGMAMSILPAVGCVRAGRTLGMGGDRRAGGSRSHARTRNALVVAEVALSLLLLVGAGLMVNSFARLQSIDPGFDPDNLLLVSLRLDPDRYASEGDRIRFADELDTLIEGLPGVVGAAVGGDVPPVPGGVTFGIAPEAEGMPAAPIEALVLPYGRVAPDYFDVVGIPFVGGATFAPPFSGAGPSIIVNESLAQHYWGDVNPVGKRFRLEPDDEWLTVTGVVRDVRAGSPDDPYGSMEVYYPFAPDNPSPSYRTIAVRGSADPMALVEVIKSQVWALDPAQPVGFQSAADVLAGRVEVPRFYLQLISAFAVIAAALAAFGLYGVLSYSVGQRLHEIGIRMALGESERGILRRVVYAGLLLAAVGVVVGLSGAAVVSRYLESLLYEVGPMDPPTFGAAALLMLLVSGLACYLPARRATRVDPVEALRAE